MGETRNQRVVPNVWYTVGGLRAILRHNKKWCGYLYPKKETLGEKPYVSYMGDTKEDVLSMIDAHFMSISGRKVRFREIKKEEPVLHHYIPRQVKDVEKNKTIHALPRKDVRTRDKLELAREFADLLDTANELLKSFVEGLYNVRFMCLCWFITLAILMIGCTALLYFK